MNSSFWRMKKYNLLNERGVFNLPPSSHPSQWKTHQNYWACNIGQLVYIELDSERYEKVRTFNCNYFKKYCHCIQIRDTIQYNLWERDCKVSPGQSPGLWSLQISFCWQVSQSLQTFTFYAPQHPHQYVFLQYPFHNDAFPIREIYSYQFIGH